MSIKLYSYNPNSQGAIALANALGIRRIKHNGSRYIPRRGDCVINWGATSPPNNLIPFMFNSPNRVSVVVNKLHAYNMLANFTPDHTTDIELARQWCREGTAVVCRTVLNGQGGAGIVIANTEQALVQAPLYVKYKKKSDEYRVHVFNGTVIALQRKARRNDAEKVNWQVRNHANGFIFQRHGFDIPQSVIDIALQVINISGLVFGAVDIIWNAREERAYVLEINTAPGLEGSTLEDYTRAFREYLGM